MFNGEFHIWRVYQEKNQLKVSPPKLFEEEPDVAHLSFIRMHIYMAYFEWDFGGYKLPHLKYTRLCGIIVGYQDEFPSGVKEGKSYFNRSIPNEYWLHL